MKEETHHIRDFIYVVLFLIATLAIPVILIWTAIVFPFMWAVYLLLIFFR